VRDSGNVSVRYSNFESRNLPERPIELIVFFFGLNLLEKRAHAAAREKGWDSSGCGANARGVPAGKYKYLYEGNVCMSVYKWKRN
jgi:hypothetical protein